MSFDRDKHSDKAKTNKLLEEIRGENEHQINWLGHRKGSGALKIDSMLLIGATIDQLETARGAVTEHLNHLKKEHGLNIEEINGIYRFRP